MLRARRSRHEDYAGSWLPEPVVAAEDSPEDEAMLADAVGLALLVVLETLTPAERLAFVLHDVFAVPFEEIATVVDRSPAAARQLASRARRRVQAAKPEPDSDIAVQRRVVDAFLAAARGGDFDALDHGFLTSLDFAYGVLDNFQIGASIGYFIGNDFKSACSATGAYLAS